MEDMYPFTLFAARVGASLTGDTISTMALAPPTFDRIPCSFFTPQGAAQLVEINQPLLPIRDLYPNDPARRARDRSPAFRIMSALGSQDNDENFYILESEVNGIKSLIFGNKGIIDETRWKTVKDDINNPGVALHYIKATIAVWHYLLDPQVKRSWIKIAHNLHTVFEAVDMYGFKRPDILVPAWREWYVDWVNHHFRRTKQFVEDAIKDMNDVWDLQPSSKKKRSVGGSLNQLESIAAAIMRFDASVLIP
ncbi:hypothetical protein BJY01DRAFT_248716 [Aspergillus pseudoustus]|uniref:Uncharacterized protein n=1 Tax=Aspergillus pseudoustus TaxID=1810923 RepID=A0ABR4JTG5_9EURO